MSQNREANIKLGTNREKPRVWIEGLWLARFGFSPDARINVIYEKNKLVIKTHNEGSRKVSGRGKGRPGGIIDINTSELAAVFPVGTTLHVVATDGEIIVTPAKTLPKKAARALTGVAVGLFVGGGLLDVAIRNSGFKTVAAVEVEPPFAEIWESNHPGSMYEMPIEEVDFAAMAKTIGGPVGLLTAGRPCQPYSTIRTLDRGGQTKRNKAGGRRIDDRGLGHVGGFIYHRQTREGGGPPRAVSGPHRISDRWRPGAGQPDAGLQRPDPAAT